MVTNSEYEKIIQNFSKVPCTDKILETLKAKYSSDVSSNRALERCRSIFDLIKLLEKRDVFSVDNIKTLQEIAGILNRTDILNIIDEQSSWKPNIQGTTELSNWIFLILSTLLVTFHYSVCWFYHVFPSSKKDWRNVAGGFSSRRQIPNCGGAIDGKHIRILPPAHIGPLYYNYKNFYSIVWMAIVNADYEFLYINIGKNGQLSDSGVLEYTTFFRHLISDRLHVPDSTENHENLNFVFIGDEVSALHDHILKPFSQN